MVMSCEEVWREVSNYLENDISPELRSTLEEHLRGCKHCSAVVDGTRNVIQLFGDERMLEVPLGFNQRLRRKIARSMPAPRGTFLGWALAAAAALLVAGSLVVGNTSAFFKPDLRSKLAKPANSSIPQDMMVVVYNDGKMFHTPQCTFIHDRSNARTMTAREALHQGYTPCVRCLRQYLSSAVRDLPVAESLDSTRDESWTFPLSIGNRWFEEETAPDHRSGE